MPSSRSFALALPALLGFTLAAPAQVRLGAVPSSLFAAATASASNAVTAATATPLPPAHAKKLKGRYTGPTQIIVLPPTPVVDDQGAQRLDPDGKPMFNESVKQLRDKKGHPVFDAAGKPVFQTPTELGFDAKGHTIHPPRPIKAPAPEHMAVNGGFLIVDGIVHRAGLNLDIPELHFLYVYAPGIGVIVVSDAPFPAAVPQANAFNGKTLTFKVEKHVFQLSSNDRLLHKPETAYILVDRRATLPTRLPVVGFGATPRGPYSWPSMHTATQLAASQGSTATPPANTQATNQQTSLLQ